MYTLLNGSMILIADARILVFAQATSAHRRMASSIAHVNPVMLCTMINTAPKQHQIWPWSTPMRIVFKCFNGLNHSRVRSELILSK